MAYADGRRHFLAEAKIAPLAFGKQRVKIDFVEKSQRPQLRISACFGGEIFHCFGWGAGSDWVLFGMNLISNPRAKNKCRARLCIDQRAHINSNRILPGW